MFSIIDKIKIQYNYNKNLDTTIIFLHGFGGNLKNFSDYESVFNNFGFSTLNINLSEYGFKSLKSDFTIYNYSEVVFKLLKRLKITNAILIGHSFGGRIAIILTSMFKNMGINFKRLILVDSAGIKPRFNIFIKYKILKYKMSKFLVKKGLLNKNYLNKFGSSDYKNLPDNLKNVFKNVVNEDLSYLLKFINTETLIIFGKYDKDTPIYMAKKLNRNIKNSKLVLFLAGHYSYLEFKQKFIKITKDFIE